MKGLIKKGIEVATGIVEEKVADKAKGLWEDKIKYPSVLAKTKERLMLIYGNKAFYNDIDKYCSQNNVMENLLENLSENDGNTKYSQTAFCDHHMRIFLDYYPKYAKDVLAKKEIFSLFDEMYSSIYEKVLLLPEHSQMGKMQIDMHIGNAEILERMNKLEELIVKQGISCVQPTSTSIAGQEDVGECSEEIEEYRKKANDLIKRHPPVEASAINEYLSLLSDIGIELRTESPKQVDQLICLLRSNISLCYCNIGNLELALENINKIKDDVGAESKVYNFVFAVIIITYSLSERYNEAECYLKKALDIDPKYDRAFLMLQYLNTLMNNDLPEHVIQKLDEKFANNTDIETDIKNDYYIYRSYALRQNNQHTDAIKSLILAKENGCDSVQIDCNLGFIYYELAVKNVPKDKSVFRPDIDSQQLLKALEIYKNLIFDGKLDETPGFIKLRIIEVYVSCCSLLGIKHNLSPLENYLNLQGIEYEILRGLIFNTGNAIPPAHFELLKEEDILFARAINYIRGEGDYAQIKSTILDKDEIEISKIPEASMMLLVQMFVIEKDVDLYRKYKNYIHSTRLKDILDCLDAYCLEIEGRIEEAKFILQKYSSSSTDYHLLWNIQNFYARNHFEDALGQTYLWMLRLLETNVICVENISELIERVVVHFVENKSYDCDVCSLFKYLAEDDERTWRLKCYYYQSINDIPNLVFCTQKLYDKSRNVEHALNVIIGFRSMMKYDDALTFALAVKDQHSSMDNKLQVRLFKMISDIYLLGGEKDKSFDWATQANQLCKENPYDDTHCWYFMRGMRTGHSEVLKESIEYKNEHPVVIKWLSMFSIDENNPGQSILKQIEEFSGQSSDDYQKREQEISKYYKAGLVSNAMILKNRSHDLPSFLNFVLTNKVKIFSGIIQQIEAEKPKLKDEVFVDATTLILLSELNVLDIFKDINKIYLTYDTINVLQTYCLTDSGSVIANKVLSWLNGSEKIILKERGYYYQPDKLMLDIFSDEILSCCYASQKHDIPMLSCESLFYQLMEVKEIDIPDFNIVSIPTLCFSKMAADQYQHQIIYRLLEKCTFVPFNAITIFYQIRNNSYVINPEQLKPFVQCNSTVDMISFANVYLATTAILHRRKKEVAVDFANMVIDNGIKIWNRGQYYRTWESDYEEYRIKSKSIKEYCEYLITGLRELFVDELSDIESKLQEFEELLI